MSVEQIRTLLHFLQLDLERAERGEPIHMPQQRAALTLEALHVVDRRALMWTGGVR